MPDDLRLLVDRDYPTWKLAPSAAQIGDWFSESRFTDTPNFATADFNNDGRPDHALLVIHEGKQVAVAFVSKAQTWERHVLAIDSADPFTFLLVNRRGSRDYLQAYDEAERNISQQFQG